MAAISGPTISRTAHELCLTATACLGLSWLPSAMHTGPRMLSCRACLEGDVWVPDGDEVVGASLSLTSLQHELVIHPGQVLGWSYLGGCHPAWQPG